jgi:hypothetical protein
MYLPKLTPIFLLKNFNNSLIFKSKFQSIAINIAFLKPNHLTQILKSLNPRLNSTFLYLMNLLWILTISKKQKSSYFLTTILLIEKNNYL